MKFEHEIEREQEDHERYERTGVESYEQKLDRWSEGRRREFEALISNIEKARGSNLSEHELFLMKKLWNGCVDCIADEFPVLSDWIRRLKQPYNDQINRTQKDAPVI